MCKKSSVKEKILKYTFSLFKGTNHSNRHIKKISFDKLWKIKNCEITNLA